MALKNRIVALTNGISGVTFVENKSLEGRMPALAPGLAGILVSQIVGDFLSIMTDFLAAQFNIYKEFIDAPTASAKEAANENVTLLELLIGFEPVEEMLAAAITVRDHMCTPGDDPARSGDALIATYRYIIQEFNLFSGSNILQAAIDNGSELAPEFRDLMDAVMPLYRDADTDGAISGDRSVFGPESILASLILIAPGGPATFLKSRERLPEDVDDALVLRLTQTSVEGFPITIRITLKQADGTTTAVDIVHPGTLNTEVPIDSPNEYISVELMDVLGGGLTFDSFLVLRNRVRALPT